MRRVVFLALLSTLLIIAVTGCGKHMPKQTDSKPPAYAVSGQITQNGTDTGIAGVTVSVGQTSVATTNANGQWSASGLTGVQKIVPVKDGWSFTPAYHDVDQAAQNVNFTGAYTGTYNACGYVRRSGNNQGVKDISIYVGNNELTSTDESGYWQVTGLSGSSVISPSKPGWSFTPASVTVNQPSSNIVFMATQAPTYQITGLVKDVMKNIISDAVITVQGSSATTTSNLTGGFTLSVNAPGTYKLQAVVDNHISYTRTVSVIGSITDAGTIWVYRDPTPPPTRMLYVYAPSGAVTPALYWRNSSGAYQNLQNGGLSVPANTISAWDVYEGVYMVVESGFDTGQIPGIEVSGDVLLTLDTASKTYTTKPTEPLQISGQVKDAKYQSLVYIVNKCAIQTKISLGNATKTIDVGQTASWLLPLGRPTMLKCDYKGCQVSSIPVSYERQTMKLYTIPSQDSCGIRFDAVD